MAYSLLAKCYSKAVANLTYMTILLLSSFQGQERGPGRHSKLPEVTLWLLIWVEAAGLEEPAFPMLGCLRGRRASGVVSLTQLL